MARKKFVVSEMFKEDSQKVRRSDSKKAGKGKEKISFSIDHDVINDLKILAYYWELSSSATMERILREYFSEKNSLLDKARDFKSSKS